MSPFRHIVVLALGLICAAQALAQQLPVPPTLAARSWLLLEMGSGQVLTAEKPDERIEPASLTKLMTAYLTFAALRQKTIALDTPVTVSQKAWKTGGSKMFIRVDTQVPVDDLIKGMIVQSGNDACVALAEAIAGSEESFAQMMNREAKRLGMTSSNFTNSTGLPDPQLYTTARDLATLASALIRDFPEEYKKYYSMKEFRYNNITQPNRNRLLYIDSVGRRRQDRPHRSRRLLPDFLCASATSAACCRSSSAPSPTPRAPASRSSCSTGASSPTTRSPCSPRTSRSIACASGRAPSPTVKAGFTYDFSIAVPRGYADKVKSEFTPQARLIAPIEAGQKLGTLKVMIDGKVYGEYPVTALENVALAGIFGRTVDTVRLWFN